jgi:hypothetical protein
MVSRMGQGRHVVGERMAAQVCRFPRPEGGGTGPGVASAIASRGDALSAVAMPMMGRETAKAWPSEAEKLYKLALSFRQEATKSRDYQTKHRFLAQAAYYDEIAYHAQLNALTPH